MRVLHSCAALQMVVLVGCVGAAPQSRTVQGECGSAFGADVCTWATLSGTDELLEFGATVPVAAIEGAPADAEMAWPPVANAVVRMPAEVTSATGVDHLTVFWEPHGHPPGAYLTPHFDFHFYSISTAAREAIDCVDTTKPAALPAGYAMIDVEIPDLGMLVGLCVPTMGMHALLSTELESEGLFTGTMVIGYDKASPLFFEPMITRELLMRRESFDLAMPDVPGVPDGVRYPTRFQGVYDAATDSYAFTFSGSRAE